MVGCIQDKLIFLLVLVETKSDIRIFVDGCLGGWVLVETKSGVLELLLVGGWLSASKAN